MKPRGVVLIAEDDPVTLRIVSYLLRDAGYDVVLARTGSDALQRLSRRRPDLIVTDIAMPDMMGIELIGRVRSDPATKDLPILVMTAFVWEHLAHAAVDAGCDALIGKPVNGPRLVQQVQELLDRHA